MVKALGKGIDDTIESNVGQIADDVVGNYIGVLDIGKHETKAIGKNIKGTTDDIKRINFRTKSYDLEKGGLDVEGNSSSITYKNHSYIIGEQGEKTSKETSKTNLLHQLSAYVAISRMIEPNVLSKLNIVLACPISVLKIDEAKEEYKKMIKGDGPINVTVDNFDYTFEIENIMVKAEGSGIVYLEPERFKNKTVAIIDFGGLNMGFSAYTNGVCKQSDRFSEEFGTTELVLRVQETLTVLEKGNLVKYDVAETALNVGHMTSFGKPRADSIAPINVAKTEFLNDSIDIIKNHKYNLEQFDELIFVGGTTQKIKDQILSLYPNAYIPVNSQWTTAEGLYKVAYGRYCK